GAAHPGAPGRHRRRVRGGHRLPGLRGGGGPRPHRLAGGRGGDDLRRVRDHAAGPAAVRAGRGRGGRGADPPAAGDLRQGGLSPPPMPSGIPDSSWSTALETLASTCCAGTAHRDRDPGADDDPARSPPRPRPARPRDHRKDLADRGAAADADEQSRSGGRRTSRAPGGPGITGPCCQTAGPLRMLMNHLGPEGAERPEDLVVYGGTGRAARSWEAYEAIVDTLRALEDDETLLVQSGKPVGVLRTSEWAPRVLLANSNLVGDWATWPEFRRLEAEG